LLLLRGLLYMYFDFWRKMRADRPKHGAPAWLFLLVWYDLPDIRMS